MADTALAQIPEPGCVCAFCELPCGSGHASNCRYATGTTDPQPPQPVDITHVPLFVVPVGMIGGVCMGGFWYFGELFGQYPNLGFLASYHKFMSFDSKDPLFDEPWNAGTHVGGVPWLVLFLPTWPLRQGVVGTAGFLRDAVADLAKPSPPKPPDSRIAVYEAIAKNYSQLQSQTQATLEKAQAETQTAAWKCTQMLDDQIQNDSKLRELRDKKGIEAAREKAKKQLDAWASAREEQLKIKATVQSGIREKDEYCRKAYEQVQSHGLIGVDLKMDRMEKNLDKQLKNTGLPNSVAKTLKQQKKDLGIVKNCKTAAEVGLSLKELNDSRKQAGEEGKATGEWLRQKETEEKLLRLNLKLLSALPGGQVATVGEALVDSAFYVTASTVFSRQIARDQEFINQMETANVFRDAMADDWRRLKVAEAAAREKEAVIRKQLDSYKKMKEENQKNAQSLR